MRQALARIAYWISSKIRSENVALGFEIATLSIGHHYGDISHAFRVDPYTVHSAATTFVSWSSSMQPILIEKIDVGTRFREDMGDLNALAKSIQDLGLL